MTIVFLLSMVAAGLLVGASALIFRELLAAVGTDTPKQTAHRGSSRRDDGASELRRAA